MNRLNDLHISLTQRKRPEDVAQMILEIIGNYLSYHEKSVLNRAAKGSLKRSFWGYTSMMQEFASAVGAEKLVKKTIEIFKLRNNGSIDYNNADHVEQFIKEVSPLIGKRVGGNNFLSDRLNKEQRKAEGLDISKRNYNKKWRLLKRLEHKLIRYGREVKKIEYQMIGKHGLSHELSLEEFSKDLNSACFIAYYNARCNLRSVFTNSSQERAFDEIAEMLFNRCAGQHKTSVFDVFSKRTNRTVPTSTNWWAIAHIYSSKEVLTHLTDEEKGRLLGRWTSILQQISGFLQEIWENNDFNRETMVVRKGDDSTTWNNTAGAWNKARDNWINLLYALGMEYVLDELCFGKVLRLMAADVVFWHHTTGGKLDANTKVWNKLPLPWEVFQRRARCTKKMVERYCRKAGLHPARSGWIAPRNHGVARFKPTPELVHGVSVSSPFLATVLKKHNYYSGKNVQVFFPEEN